MTFRGIPCRPIETTKAATVAAFSFSTVPCRPHKVILIGIGQGCTLSPLTVAGIAGVPPEDAGAASELVNVAHQLGGSLGLGILVVVFAAAEPSALSARNLLAHRIAASFTAGSVMLALALAFAVVLWLIVWPHGVRFRVCPAR